MPENDALTSEEQEKFNLLKLHTYADDTPYDDILEDIETALIAARRENSVLLNKGLGFEQENADLKTLLLECRDEFSRISTGYPDYRQIVPMLTDKITEAMEAKP